MAMTPSMTRHAAGLSALRLYYEGGITPDYRRVLQTIPLDHPHVD